MKPNVPLHIRRGVSSATEPRMAVAEIRHLIQQDEPRLILFFCSATYDLAQLATELQAAFGDTPTVGCTAVGNLGLNGFTQGGITAISLAGDISAHPYAVDLAAMETSVANIVEGAKRTIAAQPDRHSFGLLLVDGLSVMEEGLAALLYRQLPQIPIVGGSAADDLKFKQTHVYVDGAFRSHAAVFTLFTTRLPFRAIKFAHFVSAGDTLVVTRSDPGKRVVYELNGEPAAQAYANLIGVPVEKLDMATISMNPLIFEMGGENYIRAIGSINPDQSLTVFCAIETGVVLSTGRAVDPVAVAQAAFQRVRDEIGEPAVVIGCDCVSRLLAFRAGGLLGPMGSILSQNQVFGFSTYGEQFEGMHMNQTFTGIAIGKDYARD